MLQKKKSKTVWQVKYVLLLPLILGMLVYTSCENEKPTDAETTAEEPIEEMTIVGYGAGKTKEGEIPFGVIDEEPVFRKRYSDISRRISGTLKQQNNKE